MGAPEGNYNNGFDSHRSLCWICKNSVPDVTGKQGCSWSRVLKPVKGWTVIQRGRKNQRSYCVLACPEFVPDDEPEDGEKETTGMLLAKANVYEERAKVEYRRGNADEGDELMTRSKLSRIKAKEWDGKLYFEDEQDLMTFEMKKFGF